MTKNEMLENGASTLLLDGYTEKRTKSSQCG